jgi:F-type H+-transporting ATPase subunit epsilon
MATLRLEIITVEGRLFDDDVNMVVVPASEGVMGILPHHTPVLTALTYGELLLKKDGLPDQYFAIGGGFLEVRPDHVVILADAAERADEIDLARAEVARRRAEELLEQTKNNQVDFARAEASLRRSLTRIKIARKRREGSGSDRFPPPSN